MMGAATGIYLLQAVDNSARIDEAQTSIELNTPKQTNTLTEPPILPDFKTEIGSALEGRKNPDRLTLTPQVPFINSQSFIVLETLAGPTKERISVKHPTRAKTTDIAFNSDFDHHKLPEFWQQVEIGRTPLNSQCQIEMTFEKGQKYLVFTGLQHPKAFEHIQSADDKWLDFLRKSVGMKQTTEP